MDRAYLATELHRVTVKPVHLAPHRQGDLLTNARLDRLLHRRRMRNVPDDRTRRILFEQFREDRRAIPGRARAPFRKPKMALSPRPALSNTSSGTVPRRNCSNRVGCVAKVLTATR
jgi:hypothetical protein